MKKQCMCEIFVTTLIAGWLYSGCLAQAQNPQCPTRPVGDNTNACASTAFVSAALASGIPLAQNLFLVGNASNFGAGRLIVGADLPNPSTTTLGGVFSLPSAANQVICGISNLGAPQACTVTGTGNVVLQTNPTILTTLSVTGTIVGTSNSGGALAVGRLGATTPAFQVDASTGTSITGVKVTAQSAGNGVNINAIGETDVALIVNAAGTGTVDLGTTSTGSINLWRAVNFLGPGTANFFGTTSGFLSVKAAAIASGTLTFPAGTTDFSATGGASQVVKQTSAGGAFTVARLACADLSDAGSGCAGSSAIVVGTTVVSGGTTGRILYDNAGVVGEYPVGTGVATALGINVGSAGAFVTFNGALGTPSSGTVTNLTGTASININGTVGATTPATGAFTTIAAAGTVTVTSASASSLAVGRLGATTPSFKVDSSAGTTVNGIEIIAAATGGSPLSRAIGSDTNVAYGFASKGSAAITFYTQSVGSIAAQILDSGVVNDRWLTFTGANGGNATIGTIAGSIAFSAAVAGSDSTWTGTVRANTAFSANGTAGQSVTTTVRDAAGTGTCTLIFTFGLKTGGTC